MDKYEAAIADIVSAKKKAESGLKRFASAEPLGKTSRVLTPRRQLLDVLPDIITELQKCEDAYTKMLDGAVIEADGNSGGT